MKKHDILKYYFFKKKNPTIGAILCFLFGGLGFLFISWRYGLVFFFLMIVYAVIISFVNIPEMEFFWFFNSAIFAWKGFKLCVNINKMIDYVPYEYFLPLDTFSYAIVAMTETLIITVTSTVAIVCIYMSIILLIDHSYLMGFLILLIFTPLSSWITYFLLSFTLIFSETIAGNMLVRFHRGKQYE